MADLQASIERLSRCNAGEDVDEVYADFAAKAGQRLTDYVGVADAYLAQHASDSAAVTREWLVDVLGEPSLERRVEMEWWHARASPYAARWTGEVLDMRIGTGHVILRTRSEILAGKLISKLWPVLDEVNNAKGE